MSDNLVPVGPNIVVDPVDFVLHTTLFCSFQILRASNKC